MWLDALSTCCHVVRAGSHEVVDLLRAEEEVNIS